MPILDPSIVFENPQQQPHVKKIQLNIPDAIVHEPQKETEHSGLYSLIFIRPSLRRDVLWYTNVRLSVRFTCRALT